MPKLPKPPKSIKNREVIRDYEDYALLKRGLALQENGLLDEARVIFEKVLASNPRSFDALHLLGINAAQAQNYIQALKLFDKSLQVSPGSVYALMNRANVLLELKRFESALKDYSQAISIQPGVAEVYYNQGNAFLYLKRFKEAVASYDKAIELDPSHARAFNNRGNALTSLKLLQPALASYRNARIINPNVDFLSGMLVFLQMQMCDWAGLDVEISNLVTSVHAGRKSSACLELLALVDDPAIQLKAAKIYGHEQGYKGSALGPLQVNPKTEKIRIGYYSADFKEHPVAYLTADLFEMHDKNKFEVIAFSLASTPISEIKTRLIKSFDQFIEVSDKTDKEIAELSRSLGIDVAVDLGGHTANSRLSIFSYRAAPVQVNFLGYPGTLGVDFIDYIIADELIIPNVHLSDYVEKVCYLPGSYLPFDSKRVRSVEVFTRAELGLPEDAFVFAAFNAAYKINPDVFASWMLILASVSGSVLWLAEVNEWARKNLAEEAERFSIDPSRLVFARRTERIEDHLERQKMADLALDTFPYNGHTTTIDSLWSGVPVLTLKGRSFASSVAASLLTTIGLPEFITASRAEYEAKAIQLASQPAVLETLKQRLAEKVPGSALFDSKRFARNIESAYTRMHERNQNGLQPESFSVSDA
jgi:predicted O-linked N-acetylglucosamine transferase (SPINDLY family)